MHLKAPDLLEECVHRNALADVKSNTCMDSEKLSLARKLLNRNETTFNISFHPVNKTLSVVGDYFYFNSKNGKQIVILKKSVSILHKILRNI